jgi:YVTN family beta-propeller protein
MDFRILGPLEVCDGEGNAADLGGRQQRLVLAMLLLHRNEVVSVDRLIDVVWGERAPASAPKSIQIHISRLRKALESASGRGRGESAETIIRTRANGYILDVAQGELDVDRFQRLVEQGRRALAAGESERAGAALEQALALWRGEPLADFTYDSFAQGEIRRLEELRLGAVEERIDADLDLGRVGDVIPDLQALVAQHPTRERIRGQLMVALYRSGRKAEALRVYEEARRTLAQELGLEPSESLQRLHRGVLNDDPALSAPDGEPTREVGSRDDAVAAPVAAAPTPSFTRRLGVGAVAALILAALAALGALLATRDSGGSLRNLPPNTVGTIDPETNDVVAAIPVGIRPGPVAGGAGALWVGNLTDRSITKIDQQRRSAVASFSLDGRTPTGLAVGAGAVWVAHGRRGELSRIEPQFGQLARTIAVAARPHGSPTGSVAVGAGFVWAAFGDSTLARIDAQTVRLAGSTLAGASPAAVVVNDNTVWVANSGDATIQRFNPTTFEEGPIRSISVGTRPTAIAYGEGALWVANQTDDSVTRIEPSTNSTATIPVGDGPVGIAVGAGAVWVANAGDGTVTRIDPETHEVARTFELGNAPAGITVSNGFVWVTVQAP